MAAVLSCFRRRVRSSGDRGGRRILPLSTGAALLASLCVAAAAAAGTPARAAAADVSGAMYVWGDNTLGELGDGTTTQHDSPEPATLTTGVTATAVSAGATFSLAIGSDGNLYAWGSNSNGQLGDGTTTSHNTPEMITLATGVKPTAISAGTLDSLAIGSDGKLYAWGYNVNEDLGDGTATDKHTPETITLATGVKPTAISAGTDSGLAIGSDGKLYAWGSNTFGQLGDGTTTSHNTPEMITLAAGVKPTAVSAAGFDGMAIGSDGNLYAWGSNAATINGTLVTFGELGDGTTTSHDTPEVITLATGVAPVAVSAGVIDTLAIGVACSDAAAAPTCPATPTPTPSDTTTPSHTPTSSHTPRSSDTTTPGNTTTPSATATAGTSAAPSTPAPSTPAAAAPTNTPAGAVAAVQATAGFPVGAPATGGGVGTDFSETAAAAGVAVMASGTGFVVLALRRRRRKPPA